MRQPTFKSVCIAAGIITLICTAFADDQLQNYLLSKGNSIESAFKLFTSVDRLTVARFRLYSAHTKLALNSKVSQSAFTTYSAHRAAEPKGGIASLSNYTYVRRPGFTGYSQNRQIQFDTKVDKTTLVDWQDPSGFVDPNNIVATYSPTTRRFYLSHTSGTVDYYWNGTKKSLFSPWSSSAHTNTTGQKYFLSSSDGTTFSWSTSVWEFYYLQLGIAIYNTADKFGLRETHGLMPWGTHQEFHQQIGTYRISGGGLTAGTYLENTATDAATTPGFDAAVIKDEDVSHTLAAWTEGTYTTMRIGAGSVATFDVAASFPFRSSGSYILVNNPATGAETAAGTTQYVNVYQILVPATTDATSTKYRMLMLQPQAAYTSLASAQAEDFRSLSLGDFATTAPEFVPYARITYVLSAADGNTGKCRIATNGVTYVNYNRSTSIVAGSAITALTGDVIATGPGSVTATVPHVTSIVPYGGHPPAGNNQQVQYQNNGTAGGAAYLTYSGGMTRVGDTTKTPSSVLTVIKDVATTAINYIIRLINGASVSHVQQTAAIAFDGVKDGSTQFTGASLLTTFKTYSVPSLGAENTSTLAINTTDRNGTLTQAAKFRTYPSIGLEIEGTSTADNPQAIIRTSVTTATGGGGALLYHNNAAGALPSSGDRLGYFLFGTYDGVIGRNGGGVLAYADGAWSSTSLPTRFEFATAPSGSTTRSLRMIIKADGRIGMGGTSAPTSNLHVMGLPAYGGASQDAANTAAKAAGHTAGAFFRYSTNGTRTLCVVW